MKFIVSLFCSFFFRLLLFHRNLLNLKLITLPIGAFVYSYHFLFCFHTVQQQNKIECNIVISLFVFFCLQLTTNSKRKNVLIFSFELIKQKKNKQKHLTNGLNKHSLVLQYKQNSTIKVIMFNTNMNILILLFEEKILS